MPNASTRLNFHLGITPMADELHLGLRHYHSAEWLIRPEDGPVIQPDPDIPGGGFVEIADVPDGGYEAYIFRVRPNRPLGPPEIVQVYQGKAVLGPNPVDVTAEGTYKFTRVDLIANP